MKSRVLIVDRDLQRAKTVANLLWSRGYEVGTENDAQSALATIRGWSPQALIASLELRHTDGIELCRRVRGMSTIPILLVSDDGDTDSEIAAFDAGVDDYLVRPYANDTLLARLRAALRRHDGTFDVPVLALGDFAVDFHEHRVRLRGESVRLTPKEFDLLTFMARHPNRVLDHKTLLGAVWGEQAENQPEYLRVFIGQLRKKLEADPPNPRYVVTEPWVGYRFNPTGMMQ